MPLFAVTAPVSTQVSTQQASTQVSTQAPIGVDNALLAATKPARLLSQYGLFTDLAAQTPADGVIPYDLSVPLFSDGAEKYRFLYVPNGQAATYHADEVFSFPVGSVLVKTFAFPADFREPDKNIRLIETRLLIHQAGGWQAFAYVWNAAQTDATLKIAGAVLPVSFTDKKGQPQEITYLVPNKNQCKGCHSFKESLTPIGPKARNLNKDFAYKAGTKNQLLYWQAHGFLAGLPDLAAVQCLPLVPDSPEAADSGLNARARAYLDINCAHCHRAEGPASTSGLFLTYGENNPVAWGYKKRPVAAGRGSGGFLYDIDPGSADTSILLYRMLSTDPGVMMPELGRTTVDEDGIALIRAWINSQKP